MAEQQQDLSADVLSRALDDPNLKTSYANNSHIVISATDIQLCFGLVPFSNESIKFSERIVLTHSSFMRMMEHWSLRYELLKKVYGDNPTSLTDLNQELVQKAFSEMLAPNQNTLSQEQNSSQEQD